MEVGDRAEEPRESSWIQPHAFFFFCLEFCLEDNNLAKGKPQRRRWAKKSNQKQEMEQAKQMKKMEIVKNTLPKLLPRKNTPLNKSSTPKRPRTPKSLPKTLPQTSQMGPKTLPNPPKPSPNLPKPTQNRPKIDPNRLLEPILDQCYQTY